MTCPINTALPMERRREFDPGEVIKEVFDPIDILTIIHEIETTYRTEVPDKVADRFVYVGDILSFVKGLENA